MRHCNIPCAFTLDPWQIHRGLDSFWKQIYVNNVEQIDRVGKMVPKRFYIPGPCGTHHCPNYWALSSLPSTAFPVSTISSSRSETSSPIGLQFLDMT